MAARFQEGPYATLNQKAASFQELLGLKVGGQDAFSRQKRDALLAALGEDGADVSAAIDATLTRGRTRVPPALIAKDRGALALKALRWVARGLRPEHAAQKVLVDLEMGLNARPGRR
jgi:hypothetical protein